MYFFLYVLLDRGFRKEKFNFKIIVIFSISVTFGILMEICQHYFWENRLGDIFDVLANTLGVVLGIIFIKLWFKNRAEEKNY